MASKALFVLTSHGDLGGVRPTGYFVGEAAHPWQVLRDAGVQVDLSSIAGGSPPQDGRDTGDEVENAFLADPQIGAQLADTRLLRDIDPAGYDAVLFVGGHGTMWDFPNNPDVARVGRRIYEQGGVVAAVCHGPSALVGMTLSDGTPLAAGKDVAGFSNAEEAKVQLDQVVPFLLEDALRDLGARYTSGPAFTEHVAEAERLVTGQNPQSAAEVGKRIAALVPG
jgi:putative intracellular protease/amidase